LPAHFDIASYKATRRQYFVQEPEMALDADLKPILSSLLDVILPLEEWVMETPKSIKVPWRNTDSGKPKLNLANLGFFEHFEALLTDELHRFNIGPQSV
jgi:hypothetical protein